MSAPTTTVDLAKWVADLRLQDIPEHVLQHLHSLLLDHVATSLAGARQPVYDNTRAVLTDAYGSGDANLLGGGTGPLSAAALLDGLAAADFEFEHVMEDAHPSSAALPAVLAFAAARECSGADFLLATVVAYEVAARVGLASGTAVETERGFHNPGLNGTLAAAAACSKLLGADADEIASAMGVAASSSAGLSAFVTTGAMTKRLHPARAGQLGMEAALLAAHGVQGPDDVLENPAGFLHAFSPSPSPGFVMHPPGPAWAVERMIVKLSPVHALAQPFVYAINTARSGGSTWDATTLDRVVIGCGPTVQDPRHAETDPDTLVAAQYSVPCAIAAALLRDLRDPLQFDSTLIGDSAVTGLAGRIRYQQTTTDPAALGGWVELHASSGQVQRLDASTYPGDPEAAGWRGAVEEKLRGVLHAVGASETVESWSHRIAALHTDAASRPFREALVAASCGR